MSIDFDGLNSKLEHTTATGYDSATLTMLAWALADGQGENNFGRIFIADETTLFGNGSSGWGLLHHNGANTLRVQAGFATTTGVWTFPATDGQWNAVGVSHDHGAAAAPVARVNFASATVTQVQAPAGARLSLNSGYCIGNATAQDRTWDGALQHLQFFNVILTANEMDAALRVPGSIRRGLVSWWPLWHAGFTSDQVNVSFQPTATSLTNRDGCPAGMWRSRARGWRGAATIAPSVARRAPRRALLGVGR